ncbi:hypothetical protein [Pararhodospirillum oryzae]|uniref:Uncharacterized protein n=1 Tax=Pararhodospirillum oryzae TaxID=478448 RepID=A0A512H8Z7_9PROT|nr:hypothetical protein [Pararhodospirillum oryzae]GEO81902.1 hypothetical protein ROR02_20330 [Pararhodospirillum oryzae]
MKPKHSKRRALGVMLALAVIGAAGLAAEPGWAQERTRAYGKATAPFWKVGSLRKDLSALCRRGEFNQVKKDSLFIGYVGTDPGERTLTGIAKKGYNLIDPTGKAEDNVTYHFHNDGYSTCRVYEAR